MKKMASSSNEKKRFWCGNFDAVKKYFDFIATKQILDSVYTVPDEFENISKFASFSTNPLQILPQLKIGEFCGQTYTPMLWVILPMKGAVIITPKKMG